MDVKRFRGTGFQGSTATSKRRAEATIGGLWRRILGYTARYSSASNPSPKRRIIGEREGWREKSGKGRWRGPASETHRKTRCSKREGVKKQQGNGAPHTDANHDAALDDLRRKLENAQVMLSSQPSTSIARRELSQVSARGSNKLVLRLDSSPYCCYQCWERGHKARKCTNWREWDFCHGCIPRDESVDTCP